MSRAGRLDPSIDPPDWPVLVTGASGFVGGHVARHLARLGHPVRALVRSTPLVLPDDPPIRWIFGDLRDERTRREAIAGARAVVHSASWVRLGADPGGQSASSNVEATRGLVVDASRASVDRFVYTSTIHTLGAGTAEAPADESTEWNLQVVDSPYARTKREAEAIVRDGAGGRVSTVSLCPSMVIGDRDPKPTSTTLLIALARSPVAILPGGGIPIVDARVVAQAHARALTTGEPGARYSLAGPYLAYRDLARIVKGLTGRPGRIWTLPDALGPTASWLAGWIDRRSRGRWLEVSSAAVAGGFLRLHVSGDRANRTFGLIHPAPEESVEVALQGAIRAGKARGVSLRPGHAGLAARAT